jgi:hypothetical protein
LFGFGFGFGFSLSLGFGQGDQRLSQPSQISSFPLDALHPDTAFTAMKSSTHDCHTSFHYRQQFLLPTRGASE